MTDAKRSELDSAIIALAALMEVLALKETAGKRPSKATKEAIARAQEKIARLRDEIADREKQQAVADAQGGRGA